MNGVQDKSEQRSKRTSTAVRHQDLHDRLLAAAEQAITTDALATLKARTLAEAVGCSVGAIYGVFADLDALILAVNGRTLDAIGEALDQAGGDSPAERLVRLADAYLDYAVAHRPRWTALFRHRLPEGQAVPTAYAIRQAAAFSHIDRPLAAMRPAMADADRGLLARTLFSAVHGMVAFGLDEKIATMPLPVLRAQIRLVVEALAIGLDQA
ncbi:MAG: TetR/AcrR family transcriptional regulator [Janthinobacterium lividum]